MYGHSQLSKSPHLFHSMSSVPWQHLGIDLNEAVSDPDLDDEQEIDLKQPVRQPVVDGYLNNPADQDGVQEDVFDLSKLAVSMDASEEDFDDAHCEPDLSEADVCQIQKETTPCCEPDLNLNEARNSGQLLLLPDLNELPVGALRTSRKYYSDDTKQAVYAMLLAGSREGCLPQGLTMQVSLAMDVSLRCVQRIWNAGQKGGGIHAVANKKANCGRKRIEVSSEAITAIPLEDRITLEKVAKHLGMGKSTISMCVKDGRIERHSIDIHPFFRNENKRSHAQCYRDKLEPQCSSSSGFKSNDNMTHLGKKCSSSSGFKSNDNVLGKKRFYGKKPNQKFYCAPGEEILNEQ